MRQKFASLFCRCRPPKPGRTYQALLSLQTDAKVTFGIYSRKLGKSMALTRILLADDNGALLADLCRELEEEFEIVGTATNGQDAVDAVLRLNPDVIVLDISMPILNGIQTALLIRERNPRSKVLFLTIHESDEYISAAFSAGATGYVTKGRIAHDLVRAIQEVSRGNVFVSPSLRKAAQR